MENKGINFKLIGIKTHEFATFEENFEPNTNQQRFRLNTSFKLGENLNDISCVILMELLHEEELIVKLKISCLFIISEEALSSFKKENKITFPKSLMSHFAVLTVGTARGILYSKTEHTALNGLVLPTINLNETIKEDIVFDIESN
mgnify:CR=1 FL=1